MTSDVTSFSLIDEPWILAQTHEGKTVELSLTQVFERAASLRGLVGELPTQAFAITRLLLAILHRATPIRIDTAAWADCWKDGRLPVNDLTAYLHAWADRFDLLHPHTPFYQVADLHTSKGGFTELTRLIGDAPTGWPFLTMRLGVEVDSLTFAEAARWLVHCQAFDVSGIKSGAVGDPRVKPGGGKGYPIGMGSVGHIGGILLEGDNLLQTLLLNFIPHDAEILTHPTTDFAAWERDAPYGPAPLHAEGGGLLYRAEGVTEMLTWQSRRIRLRSDGQRINEVLICNGDRFTPANLHHVEAMTAWRRSEPQEKKLGLPEVYMPRSHDPGRALWRGLAALLADPAAKTGTNRPPATVRWMARLSDDLLPSSFVPRVRAIGIDYINQSSVTGEVINDELALPVRILQTERADLRATVLLAVADTDRAVQSYAQLRDNLDRAAGGDGGKTVRDSARAAAFAALDSHFRRWIVQLRIPAVTASDASEAWAAAARLILFDLAEQAVVSAGPAAWTGRDVDGRHLNSGLVENWFLKSLSSIFPDLSPAKEPA